MDRRMEYALEIIHKDYRHRLSVSRMAAEVHLSPSHFEHLFKREVGQAFKAYLKSIRLQRALALLTDRSLCISEVAYQVGYADLRNFSRDFKARFQMTPRDYGRKRRNMRIACA